MSVPSVPITVPSAPIQLDPNYQPQDEDDVGSCSSVPVNTEGYFLRPRKNIDYSLLSKDEEDSDTMIVERKIKVVTEQHTIDKPAVQEGFPMKEWTVEIYVLDQDGKEHAAKCFTKAVYHLHPSFDNPVQTFYEPPFKCTNEGWGEFEMQIEMFTTEKGGKTTISHDLNFARPTYEEIHKVTFKNPSQALQGILRETGPLPSDEERKSKKADGVAPKASKKRAYDIEKMADGLSKLGEDDLLQVIQMIHDGKTESTYVNSNIDAGEFSVDLYTLTDDVLVQLWEYLGRASALN